MSNDHSPRNSHNSLLSNIDLGEDVDLVLGVTATALTGDQLLRASQSKKHQTSHLLKAGLGAVVAVGAFKMMHREHDEKHHDRDHKHEQRQHEHHQRSHSPVRGASEGEDRPRHNTLPRDSSDLDRDIRRGDFRIHPQSSIRRADSDWAVPRELPYPPSRSSLNGPEQREYHGRRPRSLSPLRRPRRSSVGADADYV